MMSMDLRQISYFIAVAEELNFHRAAERLHVTQPPLSQGIRALETSLGVTLFERSRRGVALTDTGKLILAEAYKLHIQADQLRRVAKLSQDRPARPIRLACIASTFIELVPRIVESLRASHPDLSFSIKEYSTSEALAAVRRDAADVAVARADGVTAPLRSSTIEHDRCVAVVSSGHPLAHLRSVSILQLAQERLAVFSREVSPHFADDIQRTFSKAGCSPQIAHESSSVGSLLNVVACGAVVGVVPASTRPVNDPQLVALELEDQIPLRDFAVVWDERRADERVLAVVQAAVSSGTSPTPRNLVTTPATPC